MEESILSLDDMLVTMLAMLASNGSGAAFEISCQITQLRSRIGMQVDYY